jgi:hypothetical protein
MIFENVEAVVAFLEKKRKQVSILAVDKAIKKKDRQRYKGQAHAFGIAIEALQEIRYSENFRRRS